MYEFRDNKKISQTDACLSGPPFFVPDEQVQSLFGECCEQWWASARFPFLKQATMNLQVFLTVPLRFLREELRYRTAAVGGRDGRHVARLGAGLHDRKRAPHHSKERLKANLETLEKEMLGILIANTGSNKCLCLDIVYSSECLTN